jgi:hypothetical protein
MSALPYPYVNVRVSDSGGDNWAEVLVSIDTQNGISVDLEDLTDAVQTYLVGLSGADHTNATKYEIVTTPNF